jgi:hypothetical protein
MNDFVRVSPNHAENRHAGYSVRYLAPNTAVYQDQHETVNVYVELMGKPSGLILYADSGDLKGRKDGKAEQILQSVRSALEFLDIYVEVFVPVRIPAGWRPD